jgi:hypothetical protein
MSDVWALRLLRWSFVLFLVASSLATWHGEGHHGDGGPLLPALAGIECLSALAFAIEPWEIVAGAVLLAVFVTAAVLSIHAGDRLPVRFVFYAAALLYILRARRRFEHMPSRA